MILWEKMRKIYTEGTSQERKNRTWVVFAIMVMLIFWNPDIGRCQGWPDIKTRLLPDTAFAVVEVNVGKKIRHCPHHDSNGHLDEEQLIFCLGTLERVSWLNERMATVAKKHLEKHYNKIVEKNKKRGIQDPININDGNLTELVTLPQIGPVLAVKIVEYKQTHNMYFAIEDIKKVEGIGQGIFNAIRHYIRVN